MKLVLGCRPINVNLDENYFRGKEKNLILEALWKRSWVVIFRLGSDHVVWGRFNFGEVKFWEFCLRVF